MFDTTAKSPFKPRTNLEDTESTLYMVPKLDDHAEFLNLKTVFNFDSLLISYKTHRNMCVYAVGHNLYYKCPTTVP